MRLDRGYTSGSIAPVLLLVLGWGDGRSIAQDRSMTFKHGGGVLAIAFAPDGKTAASGGVDKAVRLWDAQTGRERPSPGRLADSVNCLSFSADGKTLAAGGGSSDDHSPG